MAGAIAAPLAVPALLGAAGFTSAGIAANSLAASWMSSVAIANGGGVAAGSAVAVLQAAGAGGLGAGATAALSSAGATALAGAGHLAKKAIGRNEVILAISQKKKKKRIWQE